MTFFTPFINLSKQTHLDAPNQYFLHVLTFCDNSNYIADGYFVDDSQSKADNSLLVKLVISQSNKIPSLNCVKPVTHTIKLGDLPLDDEGKIEVAITMNGNAPNSRSRTKVSKSDATEIDKPIGTDSVQSLWKANFGTVPTFANSI